MRRILRNSLKYGSVVTGAVVYAGAYTLYAPTSITPQFIENYLRHFRSVLTCAIIGIDYKYTFTRYPNPLLESAAARRARHDADGDRDDDVEGGDDGGGDGSAQSLSTSLAYKRHEEAAEACHRRSALRVLWLCETNEGLYVKLGQYLASLNHILPSIYAETLKKLQNQSPTMPFEAARSVLEEELRRPLTEVFDWLQPTPVASASLAQVHRARMKTNDGSLDVAVKIQFPSLRAQFKGDMRTHWLLLEAANVLFKNFDLRWSHDEIHEHLEMELDFCQEAANAERTRRNFASNPAVHVPHVYLSTTRSLCMEWIDGIKITDVDAIREAGGDAREAARLVFATLATQIFQHGFVHCDAHPGNLFYQPKLRRICILDHGLYRELTTTTRMAYARLWHGLVLADDAEIQRAATAMNVGDEVDMFCFLVLMRPRGGVGMLDDARRRLQRQRRRRRRHMTREELEVIRARFFSMMKRMPRELLLVLRTQNYLRALEQHVGGGTSRFVIFARVALHAAADSDDYDARTHSHALFIVYRLIRFETAILFAQFNVMFVDFILWLRRRFDAAFDAQVTALEKESARMLE